MKSKTNVRLESVESFFAGFVMRQRESKIIAGLDRLSKDESDELYILGKKSTPPQGYGSHGNGMLPGCQCGKCEHYKIFVQCGGKLTVAEEIRYRQLCGKVTQ